MLKKLFLVVIQSSLVLLLTIKIASAMKREADDEQKRTHTIFAEPSNDEPISETLDFKVIYWALYSDIQNDFKILPSIARVSKHWHTCTKQFILPLKEYALATDDILAQLPHLLFLSLLRNSRITDNGLAQLPNLSYLIVGDNINITDNGLCALTNLKKLESSNKIITSCGYYYNFKNKITSNCIEELKNFTKSNQTEKKIEDQG